MQNNVTAHFDTDLSEEITLTSKRIRNVFVSPHLIKWHECPPTDFAE
jgi:hypothetical protein